MNQGNQGYHPQHPQHQQQQYQHYNQPQQQGFHQRPQHQQHNQSHFQNQQQPISNERPQAVLDNQMNQDAPSYLPPQPSLHQQQPGHKGPSQGFQSGPQTHPSGQGHYQQHHQQPQRQAVAVPHMLNEEPPILLDVDHTEQQENSNNTGDDSIVSLDDALENDVLENEY
eukprot:CAMPEP_0168524492 /NCGR_PEP_ID=MMETSP0405-20121227/10686_1 /TAXON_ID=498012 /ORGANISM="Trichosphaerium sp, Strain Am-I-7 wt" /LENGTH=168 /DNA_ID=CAMNT_0008546717 /DNA_START=430 /DNA_END=936 /DNA_ORIENTATION=-